MKKNIFMGTMLVFALVLTSFAMTPESVEAKNYKNNGNGNKNGYSAFPGNSLYGRMHNPHFMYKWGNQEFEDFDELIEYIREFLMNRFQHRYYNDDDDDDNDFTELDVRTRLAINTEEDEATLRGRLYLHDEDVADVWFVYGTSQSDLDEKTDKIEIDDNDDEDFSKTVKNLDDDTRYYFRAIAEDEEGDKDYGRIISFMTDDDGNTSDDDPEVDIFSAQDITNESADLRGSVLMNDFENGTVFFVYGTDESMIEDVENDYDTYADIDEDRDNLQKIKVDSDLDDSDTYTEEVYNLEENTTYYYRIGVGYEDEDNDDVLVLGDTQEFETD